MTVRQIRDVIEFTNRIVVRKYSSPVLFNGRAFDLTDKSILSYEINVMWTEYDEDGSYLTIEIAE